MLTKVDLIVGMNQDGNYMDYFTSQSILDTEVLFAIKEGSRNPKKGDTVFLFVNCDCDKKFVFPDL